MWGLDPSKAVLESWGLGDNPDGLDRFADLALSAAVGTVGLVKPQALFLAPGVGARGATPEDVAEVFVSCPDRVMPSASRSLLLAGPDISALRDGAAALAAEFRRLLPTSQKLSPS